MLPTGMPTSRAIRAYERPSSANRAAQQLPPARWKRREGGGDGGPQLGAFHLVDDQLLGTRVGVHRPDVGDHDCARRVPQHAQALAVRHRGQPAGEVLGCVDPVEVLGQPQPGHLDHVVRVGVLQAVAADAAAQHGVIAGGCTGAATSRTP